MAISVVGTASNSADSGLNDINITLPSSQEDDLVLATGVASDPNPGSNEGIIVTAGYTELSQNTVVDIGCAIEYKLMGATPDTTATVNSGGGSNESVCGAVMVFRGVDTSTPIDATTTVHTNSSNASLNSPSITTVTDGAEVISAGAFDDDESLTSPPSGYSNEVADGGGGMFGGQSSVFMASKNVATAGAEDPGTWTTGGTDSQIAYTVALRPAGGGGGAGPTGEVGSYVWTGFSPAVVGGDSFITELGSYVWTGFSPTISTVAPTVETEAELGSYTWTGFEPTVSPGRNILTDQGVYNWTGFEPSTASSTIVSMEQGSYVWTGFEPAIAGGATIANDLGVYNWTGFEPTIGTGVIVTAELGSYTWTGFTDVGTGTPGLTEAEQGCYFWTGGVPSGVGDLPIPRQSVNTGTSVGSTEGVTKIPIIPDVSGPRGVSVD